MNYIFTIDELKDLRTKITEINRISSKQLNYIYLDDINLSSQFLDTTRSLAELSLLLLDINLNNSITGYSKQEIINNINTTYSSMKIFEIESSI